MSVQPLPYPHFLEVNGDIRDGVYSTESIRFSPMEMLDWVYPTGKAIRYFRVLGKSGKEYDGKVVQGYNEFAENAPGHEYGTWRAAAPIQEEPVALRIYDVSPYNVLTVFYEKKASPEPSSMNIRVRETGNGGLFWKIGEGHAKSEELLKPDIALTLTQGESWADNGGLSLSGVDSAQNISRLLMPGMEATFRFIVQYDFKRYVKYYTLGKGFRDTPPPKDSANFIPIVKSYIVGKTGNKSLPNIVGMEPPNGTKVTLGRRQEILVQVVTDFADRGMRVELNCIGINGKKVATFLLAQAQSENVHKCLLKHKTLPVGTWRLTVTLTNAKGLSATEVGATVQVLP